MVGLQWNDVFVKGNSAGMGVGSEKAETAKKRESGGRSGERPDHSRG